MAKVIYEQTRKDYEFLRETTAEPYGRTEYVLTEEAFMELLEKPTKNKATGVYKELLICWFDEGPYEQESVYGDKRRTIKYKNLIADHPEIETIRKRHGIEQPDW
ncbi:hypothetical protein [Maridesulfovibrio sp.]|uniref:hypothetical protein n=1 Tax=Maridesulfovibrio sp. TaxID=2795000 RepID=UPI002AA7E1AE|nr:hypothetical protein [Maridesulfovibrio sp.]